LRRSSWIPDGLHGIDRPVLFLSRGPVARGVSCVVNDRHPCLQSSFGPLSFVGAFADEWLIIGIGEQRVDEAGTQETGLDVDQFENRRTE
jgi:hypothetical protein